MSLKIPVAQPYRVTSDAKDHMYRSTLCGIDFVSVGYNPHKSLYAMMDGRVEYIHNAYDARYRRNGETFHSLGRFVVLRHFVEGIFVWARYCHNEKVDVAVGDTVEAGSPVGAYGSTGFCVPDGSGGAHVHVDYWVQESDTQAAAELGLPIAPGRRIVAPWPGAPVLCNVNPTEILTNAGLDVLNSVKG